VIEEKIDKNLERQDHLLRMILDEIKSNRINPVLDLIQGDPHAWSTRPCQTCKAVSLIIGRPFGCILFKAIKDKQA